MSKYTQTLKLYNFCSTGPILKIQGALIANKKNHPNSQFWTILCLLPHYRPLIFAFSPGFSFYPLTFLHFFWRTCR